MSEETMITNDVQPVESEEREYVDYSEKSISEIMDVFASMLDAEDHLELYKNAEALKAAFYKNLKRDRAAALANAAQENASEENDGEAQTELPFASEEAAFKKLYARYKADRAEYNAHMEQIKQENLQKKREIIDKIKALIERGDVGHSFPEFRALQQSWREIGPIPNSDYKDVYETYQHNVEIFYDLVSIDRELRDLDFKKNLEVKTKFCEMAEKLAENENVVEAFHALQKLHEEWKEFGPVAKEFRESIWDRFKAATSAINKKYQAYFEGLKSQYKANLDAKAALCEKVEAISKAEITSSSEWNRFSKEIEDIQKEWKTIGAVARKDSQKIYDRFRAACDVFFQRKKEYYNNFKTMMQENLSKKISLCEQAEALMGSDNWKKTTEALIELQKQWKEIGPVSRKKSEQLWKRFRAACDTFFENRDKNSNNPAMEYVANLKAKKALVAEIREYVPTGDQDADMEALKSFVDRWNSIGFVPMKEKEKITSAYKEAIDSKFPNGSHLRRSRGSRRQAPMSEKDRLIQTYLKKEAEIATFENNIGFFSQSSSSFIQKMQEQIATAKEELARLEEQIKELESKENAADE